MNEPERKFISRCLRSEVLDPQEEIDDEIGRWHRTGDDVTEPLHAWLGMTENEYSLFVEKPWALNAILAGRKMLK